MPLQAMAILSILPAALSSSSLPVLARSVHRADGQDLRIAQAIMRLSYGFGAMAGLIGLTMGPWLVNTFLGTHYALAGTLVGPTLWLVIPYACGQALASLCLVRGRTFAVLACSAGGVLVLVAAIPLLTIWLGSYGAIAATAVALLSWTLLLMILCAAIDAGQVTACFVRSTVWVSGALAVYALLHPLSAFLALGVSLLVLWFSAPVIGIVQSHELKAVRQLLGL
jgi:O-antigen/teichoic acid export membrane protein